MAFTGLTLVAADRIANFDTTCAAAGFEGARARRFSALYGGLSQSERRVAAEVGTRLWLPVSLEPLLTGSRFGFDDEPGPSPVTAGAVRCSAGFAALELVARHRGAHVAAVMNAEFVERIADDVLSLLPDRVAISSAADGSVRELVVDFGDADSARRVPACSFPSRDAIDAFLRARGAGTVEHPSGSLLDHLHRTADLLGSWQARPALVTAGLCHAAYGTDGFAPALLSTRDRIALAQLIGIDAEAIVYAYAACTRSAGYPSLARPRLRDRFTGQGVALDERMVRDLAELTCANELDVIRHIGQSDRSLRQAIAALLVELQPLLGHSAALAVAHALAADPGTLARAPGTP